MLHVLCVVVLFLIHSLISQAPSSTSSSDSFAFSKCDIFGDLHFLRRIASSAGHHCSVVVLSLNLGAHDKLNAAPKETLNNSTCFFLLYDSETDAHLRSSSDSVTSAAALREEQGWLLVPTSSTDLPYPDDITRSSRAIKTLMPLLFPLADYWLWLDAKLELLVPPSTLIKRHMQSGGMKTCDARPGQATSSPLPPLILAIRHPERDCVYKEAAVVKLLAMDSAQLIEAQVADHLAVQYPRDHGLVDTALVLRRNHPMSAAVFSCAWQEQIEQFSRRDQLSFNRVVWELGLEERLCVLGVKHRVAYTRWFRHLPKAAEHRFIEENEINRNF